MDEYGNFYTVECKMSKGWEVISYFIGFHEAIEYFRRQVLSDGDLQEYRLTTPERHVNVHA